MWGMIETTFGERLRRLRGRVALTQAELARKARMNPATIARLELGMNVPRPTTIRRLARALGVRPQDLVEAVEP
jgi:transcriptional regulator with XRE-family HTH domain